MMAPGSSMFTSLALVAALALPHEAPAEPPAPVAKQQHQEVNKVLAGAIACGAAGAGGVLCLSSLGVVSSLCIVCPGTLVGAGVGAGGATAGVLIGGVPIGDAWLPIGVGAAVGGGTTLIVGGVASAVSIAANVGVGAFTGGASLPVTLVLGVVLGAVGGAVAGVATGLGVGISTAMLVPNEIAAPQTAVAPPAQSTAAADAQVY